MKALTLFVPLIVLVSFKAYSGEQTGVLLGVNAFRYTHTASYASANVAEASATHADLKLGYITSIGLYLGLQYSTFNDYVTGSSTSTETRTGSGLTLGYRTSGYYFDYTILLSSQFNRASGTVFGGGSAYIIEMGYNILLGSHFYIGVGIVSKSYSWNESTSAVGVKTLATNTHQDYYPSMNFGWLF